MAFLEESDPCETMRVLLDENWVEYQEVPKPEIIVMNDDSDPVARFNNSETDFIIISMGGPERIQYRGNIVYHDRVYPLTISFYTKESRQRLRNIYKIIRSICFINKHDFDEWQLIRMQSYQELVNDALNIWKGNMQIQLENHAVCSETEV
jgi:hypothetical protein